MKNLRKIIYSILFIFCFFGITSAQKTETPKSTPIKFKSYPKPTYTEEARRNNISGTVMLRVEFLANGKIGEIEEIVEKNDDDLRKSGLVRKAIEAAKSIKFKPATEKGKPVTISKIVAFTFRIHIDR